MDIERTSSPPGGGSPISTRSFNTWLKKRQTNEYTDIDDDIDILAMFPGFEDEAGNPMDVTPQPTPECESTALEESRIVDGNVLLKSAQAALDASIKAREENAELRQALQARGKWLDITMFGLRVQVG